MAETTNTLLKVSDGWVQVGGLTDPIVVQNDHPNLNIWVSFSSSEPLPLARGHTLKPYKMEWGIIGSQMWMKATTGDVTAIITE